MSPKAMCYRLGPQPVVLLRDGTVRGWSLVEVLHTWSKSRVFVSQFKRMKIPRVSKAGKFIERMSRASTAGRVPRKGYHQLLFV
jgi:hypothetical protein